jgi:cytochrome d ubiquinol oxidase subunit I
MELDPLLLSRLQFAFVMSFHILFPAFTIGLASWLAVLEGVWLATGRAEYEQLFRFWLKLFAVSFAMGVVSGIVMSFQFGTNWSRFSAAAGNIVGPLMSYEVLTAFFLEAGFLGIMLFGARRVGNALHFFATLMVAIGTLISTFWIISANSWMQTPAGYELRDGIFYPVDWLAIIFNPSFPYRLAHMVLGAYLTTAFVVAGVAAYHLRRGTALAHARIMLAMAMGFIVVVVPLQIVAGDLHGLNALEHQPAKVAAMEAHWDSAKVPVPLVLFAIPDEAAERNRYAIEIPYAGSLILTHTLDGAVKGLKDFPRSERPPVAIPFWSFRIMVALGVAMLAIGVCGVVLMLRRRLYDARWFQRVCLAASPIGFVAVISGWITAEVGRQPYVVYGLLRTSDAAAPVAGGAVAASLAAFVVVYALVFGAGTYYMLRLVRSGPDTETIVAEPHPGPTTKRPARPMSLPDEEIA